MLCDLGSADVTVIDINICTIGNYAGDGYGVNSWEAFCSQSTQGIPILVDGVVAM